MSENDCKRWWQNMLGIKPEITEGELGVLVSNPDKYLAAQERQDALKLISTGNRLGDPLMVRIGQIRLRFVEGRETPEDLEFMEKIRNRD